MLNELTARYEGSKQENYSKVILAALTALKNSDDGAPRNDASQSHVTSEKARKTGRAKEVTSDMIELWHAEQRCQAKTARGARCKVSHNLLVLRHRQGNRLYEALACPQHIKRFDLHQSVA